MTELEDWITRSYMTRNQLESIAGRLQSVSNCMRLARIFITRLLNKIPKMKRGRLYKVDNTTRKDLKLWRTFFNSYSPQTVFTTDACVTGIGGICDMKYFHKKIPQFILQIKGIHIAHLELIAVMVGLKLWAPKLQGRFQILCDKPSCDEYPELRCK